LRAGNCLELQAEITLRNTDAKFSADKKFPLSARTGEQFGYLSGV
jgi:hypothetical protein